jgi:cell division protein FtsN
MAIKASLALPNYVGGAARVPDGRPVAGPACGGSVRISDVSARYQKDRQWCYAKRSRQSGGTALGILIGIVLGLAIAVVTALFVTQTTLPFVGQAAKSADKAAAKAAIPGTAAVPEAPKPQVPVAAGDVPDPNRSAAARQRSAPGQPPLERSGIATVTATPVQPSPQASAPQASTPPQGATTPGGPAPIRAATPTVPPAAASGQPPAPQAAAAATDRGATYVLQAGAFRGTDEADAMKLRLALMGMEAQIVTADVNGTTLHRVRVGPYAGLDAMNLARARLAENGVEATVLRQR